MSNVSHVVMLITDDKRRSYKEQQAQTAFKEELVSYYVGDYTCVNDDME